MSSSRAGDSREQLTRTSRIGAWPGRQDTTAGRWRDGPRGGPGERSNKVMTEATSSRIELDRFPLRGVEASTASARRVSILVHHRCCIELGTPSRLLRLEAMNSKSATAFASKVSDVGSTRGTMQTTAAPGARGTACTFIVGPKWREYLHNFTINPMLSLRLSRFRSSKVVEPDKAGASVR